MEMMVGIQLGCDTDAVGGGWVLKRSRGRGGLSMGCIQGRNDQLRGRGRWTDSQKDRWMKR